MLKDTDMLDRLHMGGYHGTDVQSAERIVEVGFQRNGGDVYFAPLDNIYFAQTHGERRARDRGESQYAIIQAMFPGKKLEFGMGGDQIRVPVAEIGRISVVGLRIYDLEQARLILNRNHESL